MRTRRERSWDPLSVAARREGGAPVYSRLVTERCPYNPLFVAPFSAWVGGGRGGACRPYLTGIRSRYTICFHLCIYFLVKVGGYNLPPLTAILQNYLQIFTKLPPLFLFKFNYLAILPSWPYYEDLRPNQSSILGG